MRLDQDQLYRITNRKRKSGQVRWFHDFLKIDVPCDRMGPIITEAAYQDLVKKRLGVLSSSTNEPVRERAKVRLLTKSS